MFPWYIHAAANAYQHRKKISTAAKTIAAYKLSKMAYSRTKKYASKSKSMYPSAAKNARAIAKIERQVRRNTNETQYYRPPTTTVSLNNTTNQFIKEQLIDLSNEVRYHNLNNPSSAPLSDQYYMSYIKFNIQMLEGADVRIVIAKPKRPAATLTLGNNPGSMLDPNAFTVVFDKFFNGNYAPQTIASGSTIQDPTDASVQFAYKNYSCYCSFKNHLVTWNDDIIEKGKVVMLIIARHPILGMQEVVKVSRLLAFKDK